MFDVQTGALIQLSVYLSLGSHVYALPEWKIKIKQPNVQPFFIHFKAEATYKTNLKITQRNVKEMCKNKKMQTKQLTIIVPKKKI